MTESSKPADIQADILGELSNDCEETKRQGVVETGAAETGQSDAKED